MTNDRGRRPDARVLAKFGLAAKDALHQVFHENTKLGALTARAYSAWIMGFNRAHALQAREQEKVYSLGETRALPRVEASTELERCISARRSTRRFSGAPLGLEALARLLFFTYGRTDPRGLFRAVPSGGALYPLELYVLALRVEGLEPGVYHYGVGAGELDVVRPGVGLAELKAVINWQGVDIDNACLALIFGASFLRTTEKYRDRGYRMVLMEAGEAAQNLGLLAASMGLGACLLGGFNDDRLSELLDVDGVDEAPLLPVLLGWPAPPDVAKDPTEPMPLRLAEPGRAPVAAATARGPADKGGTT